uniref:Uncharacterized protein n=1 Tax=Pseudomonas syringae pv. actinidiae TaxID=103796 RepID=M1JLJ9_PSESF|nr:hypothetical protein [Pseudomonas syringae pv. actinidiae]
MDLDSYSIQGPRREKQSPRAQINVFPRADLLDRSPPMHPSPFSKYPGSWYSL